ncbi:hypothetical protein BSKO_07413 [Bryopsis sp. KO-2023]|nr:hypothetical protein BSKO_07413 [Bryopsis sp. KO-2023]
MAESSESVPASLAPLDEALRCRICGGYFDVPTSLKCGHCYCSQCIRGHIACQVEDGSTPLCPICRCECDSSDVRPQHTLKEIVGEFTRAWSTLFSAASEAAAATSNDNEQREVNGQKRSAPGNCEARESNKRPKGLPMRPKVPPKLFFKSMNAKQVEKALEGVGLTGSGKRSEMISKYQAFRRYVETAIDGDRNASVRALASEFNARTYREGLAKNTTLAVDNVEASSFKDLIRATRGRMHPKKSSASNEVEPSDSQAEGSTIDLT